MKKLVLLLVALASLSFAADEKKEDCSRYLKYADSLEKKGYDDNRPEMSNYNIQKATANYLRYQILQKTLTFEHSFRKHLNSVYTFI